MKCKLEDFIIECGDPKATKSSFIFAQLTFTLEKTEWELDM